MDIPFFSKPAAKAPTTPQGQQQQQPPAKPGQGQQPPANQQSGQAGGVENLPNPMDAYAKMFDNTATGEAKVAPKFAIDPEVLGKVSGGLSFSDHVTPDFLTKIQSGDIQAVKDAFDGVGRSVYSTVMGHSSTLTDRFVDARLSHDRSGLDQSIRTSLTKNSLSKLAEGNPALAQQVNAIGEQLLSAHPDATPEWIEQQTKNYFITVAKQLDPTLAGKLSDEGTGQRGQAQPDINWGEYLTGKKSNTASQ